MSHRPRYFFEHRLLPREFLTNPEQFWAYLSKGEEQLFETLNTLYQLNELDCPYVTEHFKVLLSEMPEGYRRGRLSFPLPEELTDCYFAFLFSDDKSGYSRYFTVEKSIDGAVILGEWSKEQHHHHGPVSLNEEHLLTICQNKFLQGLNKMR